MEKLHEIMGDLSDIMFSMESLSYVLESLEEIYELKHKYEMQRNVWILKILIRSIAPCPSGRGTRSFALKNR